MSPAYISVVKLYYKKKKGEHALPSGLMYPTPANVRDECLAALRRGILKKDRKVLIDYFKEDGDDEAIRKKIKNYDLDGFKPLLNFIRGINESTDPKRIELLAWLTGFEPRPYDDDKEYILNDLQTNVSIADAIQEVGQNKDEKEEQIEQTRENDTPTVEFTEAPPQLPNTVATNKNIMQVDDVGEKKPLVALPPTPVKQHTKQKAMIVTLATVAMAVVVIFMYTRNGGKGQDNLMGSTLNNANGCMYWASDHYQQVPCNQKMGDDTLVVALNIERLNSFRKITKEDTITKNSKPWVWYIKLNNKVEFYTAGGNYPLDPTLRLKPVTDYIIDKYINTKQ